MKPLVNPTYLEILQEALRRSGLSRPRLREQANECLESSRSLVARRFGKEARAGVQVTDSFVDDLLSGRVRRVRAGWRLADEDARYWALAEVLGPHLGGTAEEFVAAIKATQASGAVRRALPQPDLEASERYFTFVWKELPVPLREQSRFIEPLLSKVARRACEDIAAWSRLEGEVERLAGDSGLAEAAAAAEVVVLERLEIAAGTAEKLADAALPGPADSQIARKRSEMGEVVWSLADRVSAIDFPSDIDPALRARVRSLLFGVAEIPGLNETTLAQLGLASSSSGSTLGG